MDFKISYLLLNTKKAQLIRQAPIRWDMGILDLQKMMNETLPFICFIYCIDDTAHKQP